MSPFRPKKALKDAQIDERRGRVKSASRRYAKLADYLMRHGKPEQALPLIDRAIRLYPMAPRLYLEKSLCKAQLGESGEAGMAAEEFALAAVHHKKAREYLPLVESRLKHHPDLRQKYYGQLTKLDRTDSTPFLGFARACSELGEWDRAQKALLEALEAGGQRKLTLVMLRQTLERNNQMDGLFYLQRYEEGEISKKELLLMLTDPRHIPRSTASENGEGSLSDMISAMERELGFEIADDRNEIAPLLGEFRRRAAKILRGDTRAKMDMAVAYHEMGLSDVALDELSDIGPDHAHYLEVLTLKGEILYQKEDLLAALDVYKTCLRAEKADEALKQESLYKLANLYFRLGDIRNAWEMAEHLSEVAGDYRELKSLRERIGNRIESMKRSA
ncbi:MAG: tetratricopeptide repeat protein [Bdellovibrionota bacterium]